MDTIVLVESTNEAATACKVSCSLGSVWIAEEGLASCGNLGANKKQAHMVLLVRAAVLLAFELVRAMPTHASQVVEAILDVQESMTCAFSSWLLGLLVRSEPTIANAAQPQLESMLEKFKTVCSTRWCFFIFSLFFLFLFSFSRFLCIFDYRAF